MDIHNPFLTIQDTKLCENMADRMIQGAETIEGIDFPHDLSLGERVRSFVERFRAKVSQLLYREPPAGDDEWSVNYF